jgi:hypothetical protein
MGYVIAGILVLLIVAGFITFVVLNSMHKGSARSDHSGPPGMGGDETPLGDTTEHAGEQTERGTTASDPERNRGEDDGEADPDHGFDPGADPDRPARPEDRQLRDAGASSGPQPESERLADRPE